MKIKLDENMPATLATRLQALGHNVDTTPSEGLTGRDDNEVWHAAQQAERFLITQDLDFSDLRRFEPGKHRGILLVRLRIPERARVIDRVCALFAAEPVSEWTGCFIVATDSKVRVRGPKSSESAPKEPT